MPNGEYVIRQISYRVNPVTSERRHSENSVRSYPGLIGSLSTTIIGKIDHVTWSWRVIYEVFNGFSIEQMLLLFKYTDRRFSGLSSRRDPRRSHLIYR